MSDLRPGSRIRFWTPRYPNKPGIDAPGLLRLVSGLAILSVVGMLAYATGEALMQPGRTDTRPAEAIYVATLHFLLPLCIAYSISANRPVSRLLIAAYTTILCAATIAGKGILGSIEVDPNVRFAVCAAIWAILLAWLYRSPKMRIYYALLSDKPIPDELRPRAEALARQPWMSLRVRFFLDWLSDHLETVVLLGFIVLAFYAYLRI